MNNAQGEHQNGRICQSPSSLPEKRNTSSNFLHVTFHSDPSVSGSGFRVRFSEISFGCGGNIILDNTIPSVNISSMNYPSIPPARAECIWLVLAPAGRRVQIDFVEQFYLRPSSRLKDYRVYCCKLDLFQPINVCLLFQVSRRRRGTTQWWNRHSRTHRHVLQGEAEHTKVEWQYSLR